MRCKLPSLVTVHLLLAPLIAMACVDHTSRTARDSSVAEGGMDGGMDARVSIDASSDMDANGASNDAAVPDAEFDSSVDAGMDAANDTGVDAAWVSDELPVNDLPCVSDDEDAGVAYGAIYEPAPPIQPACASVSNFVDATPGAGIVGFVADDVVSEWPRPKLSSLAVGADRVFWTDGRDGHRYNVRKTGGIVMDRYDIDEAHSAHVIGCHVFWGLSDGDGNVMRDGFYRDRPQLLANFSEGGEWLHVDESYVYVADDPDYDGGTRNLLGIAHDGSSFVEFGRVGDVYGTWTVATSTANHLIWLWGGNSSGASTMAWRRKDRAGPIVTVNNGFTHPVGLVADENAVVVLDDRVDSMVIARFDFEAGVVTGLASFANADPLVPRGTPNPYVHFPELMVDGDALVWMVGPRDDVKLVRMPKDGTQPAAVWMAGLGAVRHVAMDATNLYLVSECLGLGQYVVRAPRP